MDFKRNIFESSVRMPDHNETVSAAIFDKNDAGYVQHERMNNSVRHVPIPRIGEQK